MTLERFKLRVSEYLLNKEPFIFLIDYERKKPVIHRLEDVANKGVYFDIKGKANVPKINIDQNVDLESYPVSKDVFTQKFNQVKVELNKGNTFLLNLTFSSEVNTTFSLKEIFHKSSAPYKLLYKDEFVVFSPECFIRIRDNKVYTYPMKGTIDATLENAAQRLVENAKEKWEHNTIVDLMRNDLAMISNSVSVEKYRYIEKIKTHKGEILQTSSEIVGLLPDDWQSTFGESLLRLLPAGSISGAPKQKTCEIIRENELSPRGYYTGVFGIFDGASIDSAVAIRYIENQDGRYHFRSGGGITALSNVEDEYEELIQKIYVPLA